MLTFGAWPGVVDRDLVTLKTFIDAPPEDTARTAAALRELAGGAERFYVRCYRNYRGDQQPTPQRLEPYVGEGRVADLVAGYSSPEADPLGYAHWVVSRVREVAELGGGKVQVCEEPNVGLPLDGGRPGCFDALAAGLTAALDERDRLGADVLIGFNAAFSPPGDAFWTTVPGHVDAETLARIDFLGLDFFPDVFRPVPAGKLRDAVAFVLRSFRESATGIGVPARVPLHITETGWPTGPEHTEAEQARVLGEVAGTAMGLAEELGIEAYELFGLRDGLSSGPRMNRFGLLRDDYSPKPAFDVVRRLISLPSMPADRR
ncbi:hypothetical protein FPZ12_021985 [Amycolatopsis acidicola]|uniref:Uncharacterized protein n=1 Tax=Amycolatopsis acidicola TaxID=2596893 RepID=A0A5N0UYL1_9PSEU|nr:hypothetical protein [Amycolatopsis acidicola]KAA9158734.1 hypothetical protein FPZ12_021985 [Amycolatopsis acidicola]